MVIKEIKRANIKPGMEILHVGSGPLPLTAITLAKQGYRVKGIDYDENAVKRAKRIVDKYKLGDKISLSVNNGLEVNYNEFDRIWLSLNIISKKEILKKLLNDLSTGKKIIYRNPRDWLKRFYPVVEPKELMVKKYDVIKQLIGKTSVILGSAGRRNGRIYDKS